MLFFDRTFAWNSFDALCTTFSSTCGIINRNILLHSLNFDCTLVLYALLANRNSVKRWWHLKSWNKCVYFVRFFFRCSAVRCKPESYYAKLDTCGVAHPFWSIFHFFSFAHAIAIIECVANQAWNVVQSRSDWPWVTRSYCSCHMHECFFTSWKNQFYWFISLYAIIVRIPFIINTLHAAAGHFELTPKECHRLKRFEIFFYGLGTSSFRFSYSYRLGQNRPKRWQLNAIFWKYFLIKMVFICNQQRS